MEEREEKNATYSIDKVLDEARESGIDAEGVVLEGDVVKAIDRYAGANEIDLIIVSTRRPYKDRRFFARSVTSTLMSKLPCSVIAMKITHPGRSVRSKRVLVPVIGDGHWDRERADIVKALVDKFDSKITVFHVIERTDSYIKGLDKSDKERLTASAEKRVSSFMDELRGRGISVSEKIVLGSKVRDEIISEASHHKYDLIIAGTTMRNIIKRVVSGNPVEEILRDTPCDVMLVHFK